MKPDVILTWPRNCDYPLWRKMIAKNRDNFDDIFVVFMNPNQGVDYRDFVISEMQDTDVIFIDSPEIQPGQDWRDVAVNEALLMSGSDWIWFTEQDFIPRVKFFQFHKIATTPEDIRVVAAYAGDRMHPCSIWIKRAALDETSKYFGIDTKRGKFDHFGQLQVDLEKNEKRIAHLPSVYYRHMNGLSHNWTLVSQGQPPVYKPKLFTKYIKQCLNSHMELHPEFRRIATDYVQGLH